MPISKSPLFIVVVIFYIISQPVAADKLNQRQYADKYTLYNMRSMYGKLVKTCLDQWGNAHPFRNKSRLQFRVIESGVKFFGLGDDVEDTAATTYPQMILVKSATNMISNMEYRLLNPKGWYCLQGQVGGNSVIQLACNAELISSEGGEKVADPDTKEFVKIKRLCD
jgi:hypothetical protein